ncbi:MAG: aspartate/glutamate racemase family protein [Pseudomonadota bacterium]
MSITLYRFEDDPRPRLGLLVLQADETIEDDFRRFFNPDRVRLHISRVPSGDELNPATIEAMRADLPAAARILPRSVTFDVVGYACTSGATMIGPERVQSLVKSGCTTNQVTDPLTATRAALQALNAKRLAILSPYIPSVAEPLHCAFEEAGLEIAGTLSYGEETEANVARMAPQVLADAARELAKETEADALFLSCTNLRTLGILDSLEAELGIPVLSSNQALAWHMAWLAAMNIHPAPIGRLMRDYKPLGGTSN